MDIGGRIEKLLKERGITRFKLSTDTGIPYSTLTQIVNGRTKDPQVRSLNLVAEYFGVPTDYLLGRSITALIENRLTELGMSYKDLAKATELPLGLLKGLDTFPPQPWDYEKGEMIDRLAQALKMDRDRLASAYARQEPPAYDGSERRTPQEDFADTSFNVMPAYRFKVEPFPASGEWVSVPVIGVVQAGLSGVAYEEELGTEIVEKEDLTPGGYYYWLRVRGDSMAPEILAGDLALFRVQPEVESGSLAIVVVDHEFGALKYVDLEEGKVTLRSSNPYYPDRVFEGDAIDEVFVVGKVLQIKRKF